MLQGFRLPCRKPVPRVDRTGHEQNGLRNPQRSGRRARRGWSLQNSPSLIPMDLLAGNIDTVTRASSYPIAVAPPTVVCCPAWQHHPGASGESGLRDKDGTGSPSITDPIWPNEAGTSAAPTNRRSRSRTGTCPWTSPRCERPKDSDRLAGPVWPRGKPSPTCRWRSRLPVRRNETLAAGLIPKQRCEAP